MRAVLLDNILRNFGVPEHHIKIAVNGFKSGDICGITVHGLNRFGFSEEQATVMFETLVTDDEVSLVIDSRKNFAYVLSKKLGHALDFSIKRMRSRELRIIVQHHFTDKAVLNLGEVQARLGLVTGGVTAAGELVQLFKISPAFDRGITYSHATTNKT